MGRYEKYQSLTPAVERAFTIEELEEIATKLAMDYGSEPPLWLFLDTLKAKESKQ